MPVPPQDVICRLIRKQDWNKRDSRPKTSAFKDHNFSVWHLERLNASGANPQLLCIDALAGAGEAHHEVRDYLTYAQQTAFNQNIDFAVQVEWRSEDQDVDPPWRQWRNAHAQVEDSAGRAKLPLKFRELLALNARSCRRPAD